MRSGFLAFGVAALLTAATAAAASASPQDVVTYHSDNYRTGWFSSETSLTPSTVKPSTFGLLQTVSVDGRVDAEPLVVFGQPVDNQGTHDVVYVATENNSLYPIDAESGAILWMENFGAPVPDWYKDGDDNVFPVMGILSTPVIDRSKNALFLVADTFNGTVDTFTLHALALNNGSDLVTPTVIAASAPLVHNKTWVFNAKYQLQRPGLTEANGAIYVAFGSNGDIDPSISRGLIVAYDAATLAPLGGKITDARIEHRQSPGPFYLSSLWQSGYAPAVDESGNIFVSTGNSDWAKASYNKNTNYPDSIVKLSGDLSTLLDSFTPHDYFNLDQGDVDLGSGGTLVIPQASGSSQRLAVGGGKDGRVWLLDRDDMGGFSKHKDRVLDIETMGSCWCGPAYYTGSDYVQRVLTGGGKGVISWLIEPNPTRLVEEASTGSSPVGGLPDYGGTMPVVSSDGLRGNTAVVWFVQRPATSNDNDPGTSVTLHAFDAAHLGNAALFSSQAGTWTHADNSNANIVPTVAGGHVYVASNLQLQIYGLTGGRKK